MEERQNKLDPGHPEQAEGEQQHHHGRHALARAAHGTRQAVQDGQQEIERAEILHGRHAKLHHGIVLGEQVQDGVTEHQQQGTRKEGIAHAHGQRDPQAPLDTVQLARAKVLAHKGSGRHAEAHDRQDVEAVDLHVRGKACHGDSAVAVDTGLHQNVGERDDHVLDARGQAHPDDAGGHFGIGADLAQRDPVVILHPHQEAEGEDAGHQLADIGGDGRALHTHPQPGNENEVEDDVGDGGTAQVDEGTLGVARRVEDAGRHVINDAEQHAAKVDPHIGHGVFQHLSRGVHPDQQAAADQDTAHRQHNAQDGCNGQRGVHGNLGILPILGPQVLGHHDAGTHGHALAEADEQEDGRAAGANGCQSVAAQEIAHDDGIGRIVQLLEQVAQNQRHSKQQQVFKDAALGHQPCLFARRSGSLWHDVLLTLKYRQYL